MSEFRVIVAHSGYTSLVGELFDSLAVKHACPRLGLAHSPHVTLVTKAEAEDFRRRRVQNPFVDAQLGADDVVVLGLGQDRGARFVSTLINRANMMRLRAGLPIKNFHLSLSTPAGVGPEEVYHGTESLVVDPTSLHTTPLATLDALAHHLFLRRQYSRSIEVAAGIVERDPSSSAGFVRLGDAADRFGFPKLSMLAFGQAYDCSTTSQDKTRRYALKQIGRCSRWTEWGTTFLDSERAQLDGVGDAALRLLLKPWSADLRRACQALASELAMPDLAINSRERCSFREDGSEFRIQRFFRWIVPFHLAVSSTPRHASDIEALASDTIGVRHIVSLTEETPLPECWFGPSGSVPPALTTIRTASPPADELPLDPRPPRPRTSRHTFLPVTDQLSPSVEQIQLFLRLAAERDAGPILVHCGGGKGRAGVMIAAWIMAFSFELPPPAWRYPPLSASQAIERLRLIRPGSIESLEQEEGLKRFYRRMTETGCVFPRPLEEPTISDPVVHGAVGGADLILLVGLPGSGKSWFRNALVKRDPAWRTFSGDEDGKGSAVFAAASSFRPGDKLLIDRCNPTASSRRELVSLAQHATNVVVVFFDVSPELCEQRAQGRPDHPTLRPGGRVASAIEHFFSILEPPSRQKGFSGVAVVSSFPSALALVRQIAPPVRLLKFPRTPHLVNLGAATPDDLLSDANPTHVVSAPYGGIVTITEKVDGANLGFSLDSTRDIVVQNRSHYVDSTAHPQFKKLDEWVVQHGPELQELLGSDEHFAERYILYGEWMAATHSVSYDLLPDYFLAFDLFDRTTSTFLPRSAFVSRLAHTSIRVAPELFRGTSMPDTTSLVQLVGQKSAFSSTQRREGIYVKIENEDKVVERSKIVRGDFIAGNEHWSKAPLALNKLARDARDVT